MSDAATSSSPRWTIWQVLIQSGKEFVEDKCPRLGAALAYYTIFSIAPMLVIAVGIFGLVTGHSDPTHPENNKVVQQVQKLVGAEGGDAIVKMVVATGQNHKGGVIATVTGIVVLLFAASGVFGQLQDALNTIWEVTPKPGRGIMGLIRDRFLSFAMVGGICFLLLVSLVVSTAIAAINHLVSNAVPGLIYFWAVLNFVVSVGVTTLLFAMMFKVLPDVTMKWKDTLVGALATSILFGIGKWGIGIYLAKAGVASAYGAVGSAVVLILWVYYSSQIVLIGAEFTHVYSCHLGSQYKPDKNAVNVREEQRIHEGIPHDKTLQAHPDVRTATGGQERSPTEKPSKGSGSGPIVPAAIGLAAGFLVGKMRRGPRGKRLVLLPGVKVVGKARDPDRVAEEGLWPRFQHGFQRGAKRAK